MLTIMVATAPLFFYAGLAASPSSTITIDNGVYPGAPSYTVYQVSGTTYAKDQNGLNEYSGSDAATVIQDAVDAAGAGGSVFVTSGIYSIGSTIDLSYDNFTFYGEGHTTQFRGTVNSTMFQAIGAGVGDRLYGLELHDFYIRGYSGTLHANDKSNIYLQYVGWSFIRSIHMFASVGNGIKLSYCTVMQISDLIINSVNGEGIFMSATYDSVIDGIHIYGAGNNGFLLGSSGPTVITGSSFDTNLYAGIYIYGSLQTVVTGNMFYDNNFLAPTNTYSGLKLASGADNNVVVGNLFKGAQTKYHIEISSGCDNNTVVGNNVALPTLTGLILDSGSNNTIANNTGYP